MTAKADFTEQEWQAVLEGPPSAGLIVVTAQRGGTIRETFAIAKAYAEARQQHGASELLDEIVGAKPEMDHTRYHSPEELKQHSLQHLQDAVRAAWAQGHGGRARGLQGLRARPGRQGGQRAPRGRRGSQRCRASGDRGDQGGPRRGRA